MSNFLSVKFSKIIKDLKSVVEKEFLLLILQIVCVLIGVALGIALKPNEFISKYYLRNAQSYYCAVMCSGSSLASLFFERIVVNLGYFIVFYFLGLTKWLIPIALSLLTYRGYVLCVSISVFSVSFGLTGVAIGCFVILVQNAITTLTLAMCFASSFFYRKFFNRCFIKKYSIITVVLFTLSLSGAIIELLVALIILRPMNFYF